MKRALLVAGVIASVSICAAQTYGGGSSSSGNTQSGTYSGAEYNIPWDSGKTQEINGEFMWFDTLTPQEGGTGEQRAWVRTDYGPVCVSLGPDYFVKSAEIRIMPHQKVWVYGSMVKKPDAGEIFLARQFRTSTRTWDLRSETGTPFWTTSGGYRMSSESRIGTSGYVKSSGETTNSGNTIYIDDAWAANSAYNRMFKTDAIDTWNGEVVSVDTYRLPGSTYPGTVAMVKVGADTYPVQLGPTWFIDKQQYQLKPGDTIMFTGSKTMFDDQPVIYATEVHRGSTVWIFRDRNGRPVWIVRR